MVTDPKRLRRLAQQRREETRRFLRRLKYRHPWSRRQVMELQVALTNEIWEQIDCRKCANCCASMRLQLTASDCARLARIMGLTTDEFRRQHTERGRDGLWYMKQHPCMFLNDRLCTIYPDRPSRCRGYPYLHTNVLDDMAWTLEQMEYCPIVFNVLEKMKAHPELQTRNRRRRGTDATGGE